MAGNGTTSGRCAATCFCQKNLQERTLQHRQPLPRYCLVNTPPVFMWIKCYSKISSQYIASECGHIPSRIHAVKMLYKWAYGGKNIPEWAVCV